MIRLWDGVCDTLVDLLRPWDGTSSCTTNGTTGGVVGDTVGGLTKGTTTDSFDWWTKGKVLNSASWTSWVETNWGEYSTSSSESESISGAKC